MIVKNQEKKNKNLIRKRRKDKVTKERREAIRYSAWLNLFIGFYNIYLWSSGGSLFWNFIIGSLNIGVWVFFRKI